MPSASRLAPFCISRGLSGQGACVRLTLLSARCLSSYLFFHTDLKTQYACRFVTGSAWLWVCRLHSSPPDLNISEELVRLKRRGLGTGLLWSRILPAGLLLATASLASLGLGSDVLLTG